MCFICRYALLQEKITCTDFGEGKNKERFTDILFLMFVQCISNTVFSGTAILLSGQKSFFVAGTFWQFSIVAFTYLGGMQFSYLALNYVNFPTTVLAKSCKMIPVMLMGLVLYGERRQYQEYLRMCLVTAGISVFMYMKGGKSDQENSLIGLFLTGLSLTMDGITGAIQDKTLATKKTTTHQLMFSVNSWATLQLAVALVVTGQLADAIGFCNRHPDIVYDLLTFCLVSALGQNFIFLSISVFGALTCSVITTTRKFFTILTSVVWYQHHLSVWQWGSVFTVFSALVWEIYDRYHFPSKKKIHEKTSHNKQDPHKSKQANGQTKDLKHKSKAKRKRKQ